MTTPTQAQIEGLISLWSMRPAPLSDEGKAWEAGARQGWQWAIERTAAAQVWVKEDRKLVGDAIKDFADRMKQRDAATIERCAQICDEAANDPRATKEHRYFCINMAAAIRNLRD